MSEPQLSAVLLFGMPGVGKGTQGKLLGQIRGVFHLSTGEMFRSLSDESSDGRLIANCLRRGQLVPDDLTMKIWKSWLNNRIAAKEFRPDEQLLLLDGIPRDVHQCEVLDQTIQVKQIVYLDPPSDELMIERLKQRAVIEGRTDDSDEQIIRRRFEVYRQETAPVLKHYRPELIHEIDPMGTPAEVLKRILEIVIPEIKALRQPNEEQF